MGILTDINDTIKQSDKESYKWLYNNHNFYSYIFSHCDVARGKEYPYFRVWDAKHPIMIQFNAYPVYSTCGYIIKHWYNEEKDVYVAAVSELLFENVAYILIDYGVYANEEGTEFIKNFEGDGTHMHLELGKKEVLMTIPNI